MLRTSSISTSAGLLAALCLSGCIDGSAGSGSCGDAGCVGGSGAQGLPDASGGKPSTGGKSGSGGTDAGLGGNAGENAGGNAGAGAGGSAGMASGGAAGAAGAADAASCSAAPVNGGTASLGASCDAAGSLACAGHAQASVLECDSASCNWKSKTACAAGSFCDTSDGACKSVVAECQGVTPGGSVCIGGQRYVCGPDLVTTSSSPCPSSAPQCTGAGVCVGCTKASDCPTPSNPCQIATCSSGVCGTSQANAGTSCGTNKSCSSSGSCACNSGYADCDGNGTCEAYLSTDSSNCGSCGHSCQGAICSSGSCQPKLVASGVGSPIAIDTSYVYYADNSAIQRVPKSGGSPTYLAASGGSVRGLALDSTYVYWANLNQLLRAPKTGGTGTVLSSSTDGSPIAVTSSGVYFAHILNGQVWNVPKTGGTATLVASGQVSYSGSSLAMVLTDLTGDASNVVWALDGNSIGTGAIRRGSPFSTGAVTLATGSRPVALALDASTIYFVEENSGIYSVPISGTSSTTLASFGTPRYVSHLRVDTSNVFISRSDSSYSYALIERVSKSGGTLTTIAQASGYPGDIALDSGALFFVAGNAIYSVAK